MKRYTSEELAHHAKQFAQDKYDSAESIYKRFKSDLNRRMKPSQPTLPLKDELERQAKILAGKAYEKFYHISEEGIERKLSGRLTNDAFHPGIELDDYQNYFDEFADEMVKASISAAFATSSASCWNMRLIAKGISASRRTCEPMTRMGISKCSSGARISFIPISTEHIYPYALSIHDFEPIIGRLHQTFEGRNFVLCSFVPRKYDYHPQSIPAPYNHSNVDSDEVLYYVDGDFMSRKSVVKGQITLHPAGLPHGPHPGTVERSIGRESTDELAVMIDPFYPLMLIMLPGKPKIYDLARNEEFKHFSSNCCDRHYREFTPGAAFAITLKINDPAARGYPF